MRRPEPQGRQTGAARGESGLLLAVFGFALACLLVWSAAALAPLLVARRPLLLPPALSGRLVVGLLTHPFRPDALLPAPLQRDFPPTAALAVVLAGLLGVLAAAAWALARRRGGLRRSHLGPAAWARRGEVGRLAIAGRAGRRRRGSAPAGRLVLGRLGRRLVAAEAGHSVVVIGPSQSGKTSGLAVPALLEWEGPVVATSVKTDLLHDTYEWRARLGEVFVYDPTGLTGHPCAGWSPLAAASRWAGARRVAHGLCSVARAHSGGLDDSSFWYATAEKLLGPLLLAAATSGRSMADVVAWVDTGEEDEVLAALEAAGVPEALRAAEASFGREERQRSSVYTTAETVLAAFADPGVESSTRRSDVVPERFCGARSDTLYLVAPAFEQARLQAVFSALLGEITAAGFRTAAGRGRPLDPPLLLVLDEAANVAPIADLDVLASTAASHGIQLVSVFQDLAQLEARYGARAATVLNNHRAKLVCSGVTDPATLAHVSALIGEEEAAAAQTTVDRAGGWSRSSSLVRRPLAPADRLRRLPPGEAVLVYGHLPPVRLALRPFYAEAGLRLRAAPGGGPGARLSAARAGRRGGRPRRRRRSGWRRR